MTNCFPSTAATFGLTQAQYRAEEGQTLTETVCVGLLEESGECVVPFSINVIFNTRDGSGKNRGGMDVTRITTFFSAYSPEDYEALVAVEASIPPCTSQICATIETVNDVLIEGDENLYVSITRGISWDSRISLTQTRSEVVIEDDDCE